MEEHQAMGEMSEADTGGVLWVLKHPPPLWSVNYYYSLLIPFNTSSVHIYVSSLFLGKRNTVSFTSSCSMLMMPDSLPIPIDALGPGQQCLLTQIYWPRVNHSSSSILNYIRNFKTATIVVVAAGHYITRYRWRNTTTKSRLRWRSITRM